jgi:16S rRNA (uracil1498-N3)-methyltransferase
VIFDETWFHAPLAGDLAAGAVARLPEDEAHHAVRVLRLRPGAEIAVTNGEGAVYRAFLRDEKGALEIVERVLHETAPGLGVALPLLKGRDTEQPAEAICEFAVRDLFLLKTEHCEVFKGQDFTKLVERLRQKSLTALKQAKKSWLTRIHPPQDLRAWREANRSVPLAVAHPGEDTVPLPLPPALHVLTGPEGGLSRAELEDLFAQDNVHRLSLGPTRLRAIHAPVAALGRLAVSVKNQEPGIENAGRTERRSSASGMNA